MASNYTQLVENYIKAAGSPVDLYPGTSGAIGSSTSLDWRLAKYQLY